MYRSGQPFTFEHIRTQQTRNGIAKTTPPGQSIAVNPSEKILRSRPVGACRRLAAVLLPLQGAEGVPLTHGPAGALHVQPPPAEDPGSDADDGQLVPVRVDRGRSAEPRQEHPGLRQGHHVGRTGLQPVLRGPLGLHDGRGCVNRSSLAVRDFQPSPSFQPRVSLFKKTV